MKVDLHTHILPAEWPDLAAKYGHGDWPRLEMTGPGCGRMYAGARPFRDIDDRCWDPARRMADCDRHGVDLQVLSTVPVMFCYWAPPRHALDLARLLNDHVAGVVRDNPGRFAGLGTVPLQDADLAVGELERCVKDLGLCGVQIGSHVNGLNLDDERIFPVLERAAQLGAAVFVHPWDMLAKDRMQNYFLGWLVGMPAETTLAICSVIFGGVLERLPDLRIAFAHGGGAFPMSIGRIDQGWKARPDLCGQHIQVPPSRYLRHLYVDSLVHDAEVLRYLIGVFGADRVALGTDYPFPLGEDEPGGLIDEMADLDDATRDWVLGGTALAFLGISPHAPGRAGFQPAPGAGETPALPG